MEHFRITQNTDNYAEHFLPHIISSSLEHDSIKLVLERYRNIGRAGGYLFAHIVQGSSEKPYHFQSFVIPLYDDREKHSIYEVVWFFFWVNGVLHVTVVTTFKYFFCTSSLLKYYTRNNFHHTHSLNMATYWNLSNWETGHRVIQTTIQLIANSVWNCNKKFVVK